MGTMRARLRVRQKRTREADHAPSCKIALDGQPARDRLEMGRAVERVVAPTSAGISTESGLPDLGLMEHFWRHGESSKNRVLACPTPEEVK